MFSQSDNRNGQHHDNRVTGKDARQSAREHARRLGDRARPNSAATSEPTTADMAPLVRSAARGNATRAYWIGLVVGVLVAVATALLVLQNSGSTRLAWLGWDFLAPLWFILLLAVAAGAVLLALTVFLVARALHRNASRKSALDRLRRLAERPDRTGTHRMPDEKPHEGSPT